MAFDGGWQRTLSIRNHIIFFFENWCTELLYFSPTHPSQWTLAINFLLFIYFRCLFISFSFWCCCCCCCCCHNFILNIFFLYQGRLQYGGWLIVFRPILMMSNKTHKKIQPFLPWKQNFWLFFPICYYFSSSFFSHFQKRSIARSIDWYDFGMRRIFYTIFCSW